MILKTRTGYVAKNEAGKKIAGPFKAIESAEKYLSALAVFKRVKKG